MRRRSLEFPVAPRTREQLTQRFLSALQSADQDALLALVADDATWTSDGGGRMSASRKVISGSDRIVRLVLGMERKWPSTTHELAWLNGEPAIATYADGRLICTTSIETDGERLVAFYRVLNPDKLRHVEQRSTSGLGDVAFRDPTP